jgi:peptidoglycan/LPS O-acetylase OafA/YrhL
MQVNNFNFLRLIAACMVVLTHSYPLTGKVESDLISQLTLGTLSFSHLAVSIFFCISGFLITKSAINSKHFLSFFGKRILRIIPALFIVLLLESFVLGPFVTSLSLKTYFSNSQTYGHLLSSLLYVQNYFLPGVFDENPQHAVNGSLWTLMYEFSCYFICFIIVQSSLIKKKMVLTSILLGLLFIRILLGDKFFWFNYSTPYLLGHNILYSFEWFFYFLCGMIYYLYFKSININFKLVIFLLLIYSIFILLDFEGMLKIMNYILIPTLIFFFAFIKGKLNSFGKKADLSYGIYLYAFPIQQLIVYLFHEKIEMELLSLLTIIMSIPLAFLSWHLIEKQALKLKKLF